MPASSTSLRTIATSAGTSPREIASAIATKLEPLPEPRTPMRNGVLFNTRFLYGKEKHRAIEKGEKESRTTYSQIKVRETGVPSAWVRLVIHVNFELRFQRFHS